MERSRSASVVLRRREKGRMRAYIVDLENAKEVKGKEGEKREYDRQLQLEHEVYVSRDA